MTAVVLLSGGLDSAVAAWLHRAAGGSLAAGLFVRYGQRAAAPEERAARALGRELGIELEVTEVPLLARVTRTALVDRSAALPEPAPGDLDVAAEATARAVWVPNRNAVLIHLAAALAEARGLDEIVVGFNAEEAATFPDNGRRFLERVNMSLEDSTLAEIRVVAPLSGMSKAQLLAAGRAADAPLDLAWSCYEGGERPCGRCESCRRRERAEAVAAAGG